MWICPKVDGKGGTLLTTIRVGILTSIFVFTIITMRIPYLLIQTTLI